MVVAVVRLVLLVDLPTCNQAQLLVLFPRQVKGLSTVFIMAGMVVMPEPQEVNVIFVVKDQNTTAEQLVKLLLVTLQLGLKLGQFTALMCKYLPTKCGRFMI